MELDSSISPKPLGGDIRHGPPCSIAARTARTAQTCVNPRLDRRQSRTISAKTASNTSAMMPARIHAISWALVCAWAEECHSEGGTAEPGPTGCDAISCSRPAQKIPPSEFQQQTSLL